MHLRFEGVFADVVDWPGSLMQIQYYINGFDVPSFLFAGCIHIT